jgi:hypothetical protein
MARTKDTYELLTDESSAAKTLDDSDWDAVVDGVSLDALDDYRNWQSYEGILDQGCG